MLSKCHKANASNCYSKCQPPPLAIAQQTDKHPDPDPERREEAYQEETFLPSWSYVFVFLLGLVPNLAAARVLKIWRGPVGGEGWGIGQKVSISKAGRDSAARWRPGGCQPGAILAGAVVADRPANYVYDVELHISNDSGNGGKSVVFIQLMIQEVKAVLHKCSSTLDFGVGAWQATVSRGKAGRTVAGMR